MAARTSRLLTTFLVLTLLLPLTAAVSVAQESSPMVRANYEWNLIAAMGWPTDDVLTVTIDAETTFAPGDDLSGAEFSTDVTTDAEGRANVALSEYDFQLEAGDWISVFNTTTTKHHHVPRITLEVDVANATASGTTDLTGAEWNLEVLGWNGGQAASRAIDPAISPFGPVDFTVDSSDPSNVLDAPLGGGSRVSVLQVDEDGDETEVNVYLGGVRASAQTNSLWGWGWNPESELHFIVDNDDTYDLADETTYLFHTTRLVDPTENAYVQLDDYDNGVQLQPGQFVHVEQGQMRKSLEVANLSVTIDAATGIASGTTDPVDTAGHLEVLGWQDGSEALRWIEPITSSWDTDLTDTPTGSERGQLTAPLPVGTPIQALQVDADGDETEVETEVSEPPRLGVTVETVGVEAPQFVIGQDFYDVADLVVELDEDGDGSFDRSWPVPGTFPDSDAWYDPTAGTFELNGPFLDGSITLDPNEVVRVLDASTATPTVLAEHTIRALTLDPVDDTTATLSGSITVPDAEVGDPGTVGVWLNFPDGSSAVRWEQVDTSTERWSADFAGAPDTSTGEEGQLTSLVSADHVNVVAFDTSGHTTGIQRPLGTDDGFVENLFVTVPQGEGDVSSVGGSGWDDDEAIEVVITDGNDGEQARFTTTEAPNPEDGYWWGTDAGIAVQPGWTITATGVQSGHVVTHEMTDVVVDGWDECTVFGTSSGDPSLIRVEVYEPIGAGREATPVEGTTDQWSVDFCAEPATEAEYGGGPETDLTADVWWGQAMQHDYPDSPGTTMYHFGTGTGGGGPAGAGFSVQHWPGDQVNAFGWCGDDSLSVEIFADQTALDSDPDNPAHGHGGLPVEDPEGWCWANLGLEGESDLVPGQIVRVTGEQSGDQRTLEIADLWIDDADVHTSATASGTTDRPGEVEAVLHPPDGSDEVAMRLAYPQADGDGGYTWSVDFTSPPDEFERGQVQVGDLPLMQTLHLGVSQRDPTDEQVATSLGYELPTPQVHADAGFDSIVLQHWDPASTVTVTVDDPATANVDLTQTVTIDEVDPELPWETYGYIWQVDGIDLAPGHVVTATSDAVASVTKTLVVAELSVAQVDPTALTVTGTAAPFSTVDVYAGHVRRSTTANGYGTWVVDLAHPGDGEHEQDTLTALTEIEAIEVQVPDDDDDATCRNAWLADQHIMTLPAYDRVAGPGWAIGSEVSITVDRSARDGAIHSYSTSATEFGEFLGRGPIGPGWFNLLVPAADGGLEPGDVVTVDDGVVTKTLGVEAITITAVDLDADIVSGTSDTDVPMVLVETAGSLRLADADGVTGNWTADFGQPFDPDGPDGDEYFPAIDLTATNAGTGIAGRPDPEGDDDWTQAHWTLEPMWIEVWDREGPLTTADWARFEGQYANTFAPDGQGSLSEGVRTFFGDGGATISPPVYTDGVGTFRHDHRYDAAGTYEATVELLATGEIRRFTVDVVDEYLPPTNVDDGGGTVTTDDDGETGATTDDPLETTVTVPTAGTVTIAESPATGSTDGYSLLGSTVTVTTDIVGTEQDPIVLILTLDASAVPAGETIDTIQVFRNGESVPDCNGSGFPCIADRTVAGDGDLVFTIHTLYASDWTLGAIVPEITELTVLPDTPVAAGADVVTASVVVHDRSSDSFSHSVTWDWGDGSPAETNDSPDVSGDDPSTATHTYAEAGVYTVRVTFTRSSSDGEATDTATYEYVVVYDPSAGFVTGGGWIQSPPGAYTPEPTLEGRASFGFVARYQRGADTPDGNTEFQFLAGGLEFRSTSYDWLVVTGHDRAQFKGVGTVNGEPGYRFMLTARDDDPDEFRVRIWDEEMDTDLYDNLVGETDADGTVLGGGNIVIHTRKSR